MTMLILEKQTGPVLLGIPVSLLICCVTLEKIFNFSEPQSFNCKVGTIVPTSQEYGEDEMREVRHPK